MISTIIKAVGVVGYKLLASMLTEKVLASLMFKILEHLAKKTTNTVDDELVKQVKESYYGS